MADAKEEHVYCEVLGTLDRKTPSKCSQDIAEGFPTSHITKQSGNLVRSAGVNPAENDEKNIDEYGYQLLCVSSL